MMGRIIFLAVITVIYIGGMTALIRERILHPSKAERVENQSGPMMIGATMLYLALLYQGLTLMR